MKNFRDKRASASLRSKAASSHTPEYAAVRISSQASHLPEADENGVFAFQGRKFLVTAGPTVEAIDPVRFISNHSTGKMGYAVAAELAARGADVVLVSGPTALDTPEGVERVDVVSAEDMYRACVELWPGMDGAVMCAAVADYTPAEVSATKIKKSSGRQRISGGDTAETGGDTAGTGGFSIALVPTKDIAAELGRTKRQGQVLVGFALETDNEEANALSKLGRKNLDMIVLNSLRDAGAGFGGDTNRITVFSRGGDKANFPLESKTAAAAHIVDVIAAAPAHSPRSFR